MRREKSGETVGLNCVTHSTWSFDIYTCSFSLSQKSADFFPFFFLIFIISMRGNYDTSISSGKRPSAVEISFAARNCFVFPRLFLSLSLRARGRRHTLHFYHFRMVYLRSAMRINICRIKLTLGSPSAAAAAFGKHSAGI